MPIKLTLAEAARLALAHNLGLKAKEEEIAFAQGTRLSAFQTILPTIDGNASYQRNIKKPVLFFPNATTGQVTKIELGKDNSYDFQARATQSLFDFGGMYFALKHAGLSVQASRSLYEDAKNEIVYETTLSYYQLHYLKENAGVAEGMAAKAETALAHTQSKKAKGLATGYDVLKAQADVAEEHALALEARQGLAQGEDHLRTLLDLPRDAEIELADSIELPSPVDSFDTVFTQALSNNPFLKQLHFTTDSLKAALHHQETRWAPRLDAQFKYDLEGETDSSFPDDSEFAQSVNTGVALSVPFFDGLRREGEIAQAKASYLKAVYEMKQSTRDFEDSFKKAYDQASLARAQYEAQVAVHALTQEAARAATLRRKQGLSTGLELTTAALGAQDAHAKLVQAEWNVISTRAYLERLMGQTRLNKERLPERNVDDVKKDPSHGQQHP